MKINFFFINNFPIELNNHKFHFIYIYCFYKNKNYVICKISLLLFMSYKNNHLKYKVKFILFFKRKKIIFNYIFLSNNFK